MVREPCVILTSTTLVEKNLGGNYHLCNIGKKTIGNYNLKGMITSHSSSERETSEKGIVTSHTVGEGTIGDYHLTLIVREGNI